MRYLNITVIFSVSHTITRATAGPRVVSLHAVFRFINELFKNGSYICAVGNCLNMTDVV